MKDLSKSLFSNVTVFQGSNDGTTYTDIFTINDNVHEGWNYQRWESSDLYPKYRFFRFSGVN
jgi:hypothetical protein